MDPKNSLPREEVYNTSDEVPERRRLGAVQIFAGIFSILMVLFGIVWLAEIFGLLAAISPTGLGVFGGWLGGFIGLLGVVLLIWLVISLRNE